MTWKCFENKTEVEYFIASTFTEIGGKNPIKKNTISFSEKQNISIWNISVQQNSHHVSLNYELYKRSILEM
jgi:2-hydroxy-3-keto-5-methylthiopentenyl-1-phosphate phosphatase